MISEKELKGKIDALCKDKKKLAQIKDSIRDGVEEQYPAIRKLYSAKKVMTKDFQSVFCAFYRLRGLLDRDAFSKFIAEGKSKSIDLVIRKIARYPESRSNLSFASKALHTIDNDLPIFDSSIQTFLHISRNPTGSFDGNVQRDSKIYEELKALFGNRKRNGLSNLAEIFDKMYPGTDFSETKKIDFILWGSGRVG